MQSPSLPLIVPNQSQNLELIARLYQRFYTDRHEDVIRIINDFLFYQNLDCRFLVGKAVALRKNHIDWLNGLPPNSETRSSFDSKLVHYFPYYSAARRLSNMKCYCTASKSCGENCLTFYQLFKINENEIKDCTNEVLIATYNTSMDHIIEDIREYARKREKKSWARN
jgi:hypothetical protein